MYHALQPKTWSHAIRLAALAAGVMGLAGCMAGYSYVQPGVVGAGGYYAGDTAYPAYYGGGYAYGSPYNLNVSIGNAWGPGYYGGYGYGYAYPSYYRGHDGRNWHHSGYGGNHGSYGNHGGHQGGHAWHPTQSSPTSQAGGFAPPPRAYARPAPYVQRPVGRPGAPSIKRR